MSFDNEYPNRKDWRKPYRKSKRFDRSCRNNGGCPWCEGNRLFNMKKELEKIKSLSKEEEIENDYWDIWEEEIR